MVSHEIKEALSFIPMSLRIALANYLPDRSIRELRVQFGRHPRQHLIAFEPPDNAPNRDSFILFVHGGGWNIGKPSHFRFIARFFARMGYPVILAGYRLTPEYRFPAQMHDVFDALCWANSSGWKGADGRKVIVVGQSAGAQLGALLVYNKAELIRRSIDQSLFAGFISISGPLDFTACKRMANKRLVTDYLGDLSCWEQADPLHHVDGSERVPVLCLHGENDPLIEPECSLAFARRINNGNKGLAEVRLIRGAHHAGMLNMFLRDHPGTQLLQTWLQRRLVGASSG